MEQEIDLRPYIAALLRRWKLIVALASLSTVAAIVFTLLQPRLPTATAEAIIIPTSSRITLDERFVTGEAPAQSSVALQRQALLGLARSHTIEARVLEQLPASMRPANYEPGLLLEQMNVRTEGDLMRFSASAATAAEALALAEAWGKSYDRWCVSFTHATQRGTTNSLNNSQHRNSATIACKASCSSL
ncbi:hypothetical protein HC891_22490 [Candidatus Gracilibacteria bacterium]|nr:hypothetical protein [Candidatus Gracilibacteria bacterium]